MSKLVDLEAFRAEQITRRGFAGWQKRFGKLFTFETRLSDLPNHIIGILAEPGEESASIFYELIMGILSLGNVNKFDYLKLAERLKIMDIHLFLADLVRYEMMERIQWIGEYTSKNQSLIYLVETFDQSDYSRYATPPQLSRCHPEFEEFNKRITREKEVMLRQLHREALNVFKTQFK